MRWASPDSSEGDIWEALRLAAAEDFVRALPRGAEYNPRRSWRKAFRRAATKDRSGKGSVRGTLHCCCWMKLTSNLDSENEQRIFQALQQLRGTMTVVFISHRPSAVQCADQVVIEGGRVAPRTPIRSDSWIKQTVWDLQPGLWSREGSTRGKEEAHCQLTDTNEDGKNSKK